MIDLTIDLDTLFKKAREIHHSLECVAELFSWSTNFDNQEPFVFFLRVTGLADDLEDLGMCLPSIDMNEIHNHLAMYEFDLLGECLRAYAQRPGEVLGFIKEI